MKLFFEILFRGTYRFFTDRMEREFMRLVFLYGSVKRFKEKGIRFLSYKIRVPDSLSFIWQFKDIFTEGNYKFETAKVSPVIYDCGANIGMSCIYFKKLYPQAMIKAFEADPGISALLASNLTANNINDVEVINKAVWINDTGVDLNVEGADGSSIYTDGNKVSVESIRLKVLLDSEVSIDLLKIDIEGAELEVLRDCRNSLTQVKKLFVEFHSFTNRKQELDELLGILRSNNFRYYINNPSERRLPFINKWIRSNPNMDLQLNIYAYKNL